MHGLATHSNYFRYFSAVLWSPCLTLAILLFAIMIDVTESMKLSPTTTAARSAACASEQQSHWLVVDFDGTCSEKDTTPLLPKLASLLLGHNDDEMQQQLSTFSELEQEFFQRYKAAQDVLCHETMSLEQALDSLDDVSNLVTEKVSASGVLKGLAVPPDEILRVIQRPGHAVELRPGCVEVLARAFANNSDNKKWNLGILSINWSPALIHAALIQPLQEYGGVDEPPIIWSNQVDDHGIVSMLVPGAIAKKERISQLQQEQAQQQAVTTVGNQQARTLEQRRMVVYVGDSSTDLAALVAADIGILIGYSNSTIRMANLWNVRVLPLAKRNKVLRQVEGNSVDDNIIWTVDTWSEIGALLSELDGTS